MTLSPDRPAFPTASRRRVLPRFFWLPFLLGLLVFLRGVAVADGAPSREDGISEINAAIREKGARWVAGETSVSRLSTEQRRRMLSPMPPLPARSGLYRHTLAASAASEPPDRYDLRNVDGHSFVTPVRDQGPWGTCSAFGLAASLESRVLQVMNRPDIDLDLSEQTLVSCYVAGRCLGNTCYMIDFIRDEGLPPESCGPYTGSDDPFKDGSCPGICPDWKNKAYRSTGWHVVDPWSVDALKRGLYEYGAMSADIFVFDDFFSYTSGVYSHVTGEMLGSHAVAIVGYDDEDRYFICKNSWGGSWGEAGFFRIAYSEVEGACALGPGTYAIDGVMVPGAALAVSRTTLDFGTLLLPAEVSRSLPVTVGNVGSVVLANVSLRADDPHFSVSRAVISSLGLEDSVSITVTYTATGNTAGGRDNGILSIVSGDCVRRIALTGAAAGDPSPGTSPPGSGSDNGSGGGCFIATASFGSGCTWQVSALKELRDRRLATCRLGRLLVARYYALSPPVARVIAGRPVLKLAVRLFITPVAFALVHPLPASGLPALCLAVFLLAKSGRRAFRRRGPPDAEVHGPGGITGTRR